MKNYWLDRKKRRKINARWKRIEKIVKGAIKNVTKGYKDGSD